MSARAGRIYLDLADARWRAVEVGPDGWHVIGSPPVRFRRPAGMLPLPFPVRGGSIEALGSLLNLPHRNDFVLVVAWLLATLRSGGPHPLLAVAGEQGSAKTVLSKLLKALIDPHAAPVRALARDERELMIAATHSHLLAFDNLSGLPAFLSDALCRLASGGSLAVRRLYTDEDEMLFQAARPILLNGIENVVSRADLADRAIFLTMAPIADERRRSEAELWREFERVRPAILGALLDAAAHGLRTLPRVRLDRLPRMADFAIWATACETAFWSSGTFVHCYEANRRASIETSSTPTRWPPACARSWPSVTAGPGPPRTCCGWAPVAAVTVVVIASPAGPEVPANSPAVYAGRRRPSGRSASTSPSLVRGAPATGSSDSCHARNRQYRHQHPTQRMPMGIRTVSAGTDRSCSATTIGELICRARGPACPSQRGRC